MFPNRHKECAVPVAPLARTLDLDHLTPSEGLTPVASGWHADGNRVQFTAAEPLAPGWYQLKLRLRSHGSFTIRKRAELTFEGAGKPISKDVMAWNRLLEERFLLHLPREATRMALSLFHVEGDFDLERFSLARISDSMVAVAAFQEKLRLIKAYNCLKPVLRRGAGLLIRGQFRAFRSKVLKGLADSRVMRVGAYKANEVDASWWRRHALAPEEAETIRQACDAMTAPPPLAVLLLVDPKNFDQVRLAAHSVRRQIYPHWELLLACSAAAWLQPHLAMILGDDSRVKIALVDEDDGLGAAIAQAIADTDCDRIIVLPPGVELAEGTLFHFAEALKENPALESACGKIYDGSAGLTNESDETTHLWMTRTRRLSDSPPDSFKPAAVEAWVSESIAPEHRRTLGPILGYPLDDSPLIDRARVGTAIRTRPQRLHIAGDLLGISGWDHVVYSVLRGMPSFDVKFRQHPVSQIRPELVPPQFLPPIKGREPFQKQLAISPPFLADRFELDKNSALFTMWETDALPPSCVRTLNKAGLVIVPSRWSVECFRRSGVTVPMEVAPLGCDQLVYNADGSFPEVCTFGTAGALAAGGVRKNAQRMIDLFRQAFPGDQNVRLRVKISPSSPAIETHDDERIDVVRAVLPHAELAGWYRSLSAYVNGSFGEGFGLHLIEAMACGRPLITSNYSGLTAFFEPSLGYAIDYKLVPVKNDIYIGQWADPSDESIVKAMHRIFADQAEAREFGERCAARAKNFSWKAAGRQLHAALAKHGFVGPTRSTP